MEDDVKHRKTKQRRAILDVLKSTKSHPTADWVYEKVKRKIPNLSLGTVYKNLNLLTMQGEIIELNYGKDLSRFDGNASQHYHFICELCGEIFDVDMPLLFGLDEELSQKTGFNVHNHRLEFYGYCSACLLTRGHNLLTTRQLEGEGPF